MGGALFIDEYRLLATDPGEDNPALVLWDFSVGVKPEMKPAKFILELEEPISGRWLDIWRTWGSLKTALPFRDDPGAGIVFLLLKEAETGGRTFVIPVRALVGLTTPENGLGDPGLRKKHSTFTILRWDDWKHFVVSVGPPEGLLGTGADPILPFVFHSQLAYLERAGLDVFLHVYNFSESLYSGMAKKVKSSDAPSLRPYVPRRFKLPDRPYGSLEISVTSQGLVFTNKVRTML